MKLSQEQLRTLIEGIVNEGDKDRNKKRNAVERNKKRRKPSKPFKKGVNPFTKKPIKEAGPDRHRVDKAIGNDLIASESGELAMQLANKILGDESLGLRKTVLNYVAKNLSMAGVGGQNVPKLSGSDMDEILLDSADESFREFESVVGIAINDLISDLTGLATDSLSDVGPAHDEMAEEDPIPDDEPGMYPPGFRR